MVTAWTAKAPRTRSRETTPARPSRLRGEIVVTLRQLALKAVAVGDGEVRGDFGHCVVESTGRPRAM